MNREEAWAKHVAEAPGLSLSPIAEPEVVPNGSFESGNGMEPDGWRLSAGQLGVSTVWLERGGVDGGRCLWISPKGGGASWYCHPIPVEGGREYLFRCATKREGVRHWAHACAVSWVSLVFLDGQGKFCRRDARNDQPLVLVRCRQTAGWVSGTKHLAAPENAAYVQVGFRIERGEPDVSDAYGFREFWHGEIDTGAWWIDDVGLTRLPIEVAPAQGLLTLDCPEGPARFRVQDASGTTFAPEGSIEYKDGGGCFHALRERVQLALQPGLYTVEAMRGFRRRVFREVVTVSQGKETRVEARLPWVEKWPAHRWYSGDHHNHLSFHGATRYPLMSIDDLCQVARGEGLDFVSFCGEIVDQHAYAEWRSAGRREDAKPDGAFCTKDFICSVSHEVTQDLLGHVCLVNAPGKVAPGHPWWIAPTNAALATLVRKSDASGTVGAVVLAHPYDKLTEENLFETLRDPSVTGLQRELPVDVALGLADTMDFLAAESSPDLALRFRDYYRLLNLGMRIGVSGASDAYADQGTELVGSLRTVVRAESFTMNAIAAGYRRQRTLATNGPLVTFRANEGCPGDTVAGPQVRLHAEAYSVWGITALEIVAGGGTVAEATPGQDGRARIETEVSFDRSQWLVARAWGPGHYALNTACVAESDRQQCGQWCVSSPIYVSVPGKPLLPRHEDAAYFVRWIDASCEAIRGRRAVLQGQGPHGPAMTDADVDAALDLFHAARKVYEGLL